MALNVVTADSGAGPLLSVGGKYVVLCRNGLKVLWGAPQGSPPPQKKKSLGLPTLSGFEKKPDSVWQSVTKVIQL